MNKFLLCLIVIIIGIAFVLINKRETTRVNSAQILQEKNMKHNQKQETLKTNNNEQEKAIEYNKNTNEFKQHYYHYISENNISEISLSDEQYIEVCNKYLEQYPENLFVTKRRARTYASMEKYDKAIKDYESLIGKEPQNIEYINELIDCYIEKNDLNQAKTLLDKYYANIEKSADYYYLNGKIQEKHKKYDSALDFYNKAIELNDKKDEYYISRSGVYLELKMFEKSMKDQQMIQKLIKERTSSK